MCVCACVCVFVCICIAMHMFSCYIWMTEDNLNGFLQIEQLSFYFLTESHFLELIKKTRLNDHWYPEIFLYLPTIVGIVNMCSTSGLWGWLKSSCLHIKSFTYWYIYPTLDHYYCNINGWFAQQFGNLFQFQKKT